MSAPATVRAARRRGTTPDPALTLLTVSGLASIALQRVAVSAFGGQISLAALALVATWVLLFVVHGWRLSRGGLAVYLTTALAATVITLANSARDNGFVVSLPALALLVVTYLPLVLAVRPPGLEAAGWSYAHGVIWAVRVGALLVFVQAAVQWALGVSWDPVLGLPETLQTAGFNSVYDLSGVSPNLGLLVKPNGVIFLEPSFVSLYCAIALVLELYRLHDEPGRRESGGGRWFWLVVYVLAFGLSMSSSGIVVILAAALPLLVRFRHRIGGVLGSAVVLVLVFVTGLFGPFLGKVAEGTAGTTSTGLRLVLPYQFLTPQVMSSPLIGHGAGTADAITGLTGIAGLQTTTLLKAALEYGLPFAVALLVVVLAQTTLHVRTHWGLALALLAAWLLPSEALTSGPLVALLLFMLPNLTARPASAVAPEPDLENRATPVAS